MQKRTSTKHQSKEIESIEPLGIVISRGSRDEDAPRFAAYVWGPVPDADIVDELVAVA